MQKLNWGKCEDNDAAMDLWYRSPSKPSSAGHGKVVLAHLIAASFFGLIVAAVTRYRQRRSKPETNQNPIPRLERTGSGRVGRLEKFSHYVARQIGFEDVDECAYLCKLANDYLRKSKGCEQNIFEFFANESDANSLYVKLVEEFERCILSYFAFHWSQASFMITEALNVESEHKITKLKSFVMAATRKQRFERVTKDLKVTRVISTLVEEMKAINGGSSNGESQCTDVMVHQSSTDAASSLLVTALNEGRDVIMDGTLSWVPFVEQTIAMARNVHKCRYRMGVGYKVTDDGTITENYWEQVQDKEEGDETQKENGEADKKPYRIELAGVICDPYLAVVRGIRYDLNFNYFKSPVKMTAM
ncbi:hypothetical protein L1049_017696 [Liquidambar formosana]|uniref:Uncharacterized protein n=1 Tax=Liquidambar formosana TaxID=63359 RepID=A0AAP0X4I9_LIQFO